LTTQDEKWRAFIWRHELMQDACSLTREGANYLFLLHSFTCACRKFNGGAVTDK